MNDRQLIEIKDIRAILQDYTRDWASMFSDVNRQLAEKIGEEVGKNIRRGH